MESNNNNAKEAADGINTSHVNNPQHPPAYTPSQTSNLPSTGLSFQPPAATQAEPSAPQYPSVSTSNQPPIEIPFNFFMPQQNGVSTLQQLHQPSSNAPGLMHLNFQGNNIPLDQYGEAVSVPSSEANPAKPSNTTSNLENPIPTNSALLQVLNGSLSKSPPADGVPPAPSQELLLSQGPMLLSQLNSVAEYLAARGDFSNAIKYYERITDIDNDNGAAWTALGHCYLLTDELQKAFTAYQKALYVLPDVRDPQLWYGIGLLYDKVDVCLMFSLKHMSMRYLR